MLCSQHLSLKIKLSPSPNPLEQDTYFVDRTELNQTESSNEKMKVVITYVAIITAYKGNFIVQKSSLTSSLVNLLTYKERVPCASDNQPAGSSFCFLKVTLWRKTEDFTSQVTLDTTGRFERQNFLTKFMFIHPP